MTKAKEQPAPTAPDEAATALPTQPRGHLDMRDDPPGPENKEAKAEKVRPVYVAAQNAQTARRYAAEMGYETQHVRFITNPDALGQIKDGDVLLVGPGADNRDGWPALKEAIDARGLKAAGKAPKSQPA